MSVLQRLVQIPLWTIRTYGSPVYTVDYMCSDSSMDDKDARENMPLDYFALFRFLYGR